jgi:hypothetical protein
LHCSFRFAHFLSQFFSVLPLSIHPDQVVSSTKSFIAYTDTKANKADWLRDLQAQIAAHHQSTTSRHASVSSQPSSTPALGRLGSFLNSFSSGGIGGVVGAATVSSSSKPVWQQDQTSNQCFLCNESFTFLNRRHHCRRCGVLCCGDCSKARLPMPTASGSGASAGDAPLERMCDRCKTELTAGPAVAAVSAVPASPSSVSASAHQSHSVPPVARSASMSVSGATFSDTIIEEEPSDLDANAGGKQKSDSVSSTASTASSQSQSAVTVAAAEGTNSATADTQANASASKPKKSGLFSGLVSSIRSAFGADSATDAAKAASATEATRPKSASFARAVDDFAAEIIVVPNHGDNNTNTNVNGDRAEMGFDTPIAAVGVSAAGSVAVADNEVLVLAGDSDSDSDNEDIANGSGQTIADETVANSNGSAALVGESQSQATSDTSTSAADGSEAASSSALTSSSEGSAIAEVFAKVDFQGDEESANDGSELHFYIGDTIRVTQKVRKAAKARLVIELQPPCPLDFSSQVCSI